VILGHPLGIRPRVKDGLRIRHHQQKQKLANIMSARFDSFMLLLLLLPNEIVKSRLVKKNT